MTSHWPLFHINIYWFGFVNGIYTIFWSAEQIFIEYRPIGIRHDQWTMNKFPFSANLVLRPTSSIYRICLLAMPYKVIDCICKILIFLSLLFFCSSVWWTFWIGFQLAFYHFTFSPPKLRMKYCNCPENLNKRDFLRFFLRKRRFSSWNHIYFSQGGQLNHRCPSYSAILSWNCNNNIHSGVIANAWQCNETFSSAIGLNHHIIK